MFTQYWGLVEGNTALTGMSVIQLKDLDALPVGTIISNKCCGYTEYIAKLLHSLRGGVGERK